FSGLKRYFINHPHMEILVINCGSSSLKADLIEAQTGQRLLSLRIDRVHSNQPSIHFSDEKEAQIANVSGHAALLKIAFPRLLEKIDPARIKGLGHRVVHGGSKFDEPVIIDEAVEQKIEELSSLAPLHNPPALLAIKVARSFFSQIPHIAVFDTAFHATLPNRARQYALPKDISEQYGIRRFGFHGTSHQFVAERAAKYLSTDLRNLRLITCHLGSGASVCAVEYGRSVETSMGMTPLEGLVMGTRSGDLDPGIILHLLKEGNMSAEEIDTLLNQQSGLEGISGVGNDMRDIVEAAAEGNESARRAIHVFAHRLRKYIGAYAAVMGGVDAIVFTGGIGENSAIIRHRASQRLDFLGAIINEDKNRDLDVTPNQPVEDISASHSRSKILVVSTDEQYAIAQKASLLIQEKFKVNTVPIIPIAISARHIHLTQEAVEALFGAGYQLTEFRPLSQPGQFACKETLTIIGPKNKIERVRILGPTRSKNQVEISRTDEFFLGIDAPIRESGQVENTPGITLMAENGNKVELKEGVICAWRHIHMTPEDAEIFQVKDRDVVEIRIENEERSLTFGNVLIRVSPKYKLEMHIDTDEGNAAEISPGDAGSLITTSLSGHLTKRAIRYDQVTND
ncbi:MAG: acetate/propionate family kinase, partial [Bacteroidota bacterium]